MARNLIRVPVSLIAWQQWLTTGAWLQEKILEGLPENAVLVASYYNDARSEVVLVFQHPDLPNVTDGAEIPELLIKLQDTSHVWPALCELVGATTMVIETGDLELLRSSLEKAMDVIDDVKGVL